MKRTLAIVLSIVMMLATCTILASAANTWGTTQEDFAAVGDLEIAWDPDVKTKITFDGKMDDWVNAGYTPYKVEPRNMAAWVGDSTTMPENWSLTAYFVADSERLTPRPSSAPTLPAMTVTRSRSAWTGAVTLATTWTLTALTPWLTRRTFSTPSL